MQKVPVERANLSGHQNFPARRGGAEGFRFVIDFKLSARRGEASACGVMTSFGKQSRRNQIRYE